MNFNPFKLAVQKQFERMSKHPLFRAGVSKDALWETYLGAFTPADNPLHKTRTEHDCTCCKQFIRAVGDMVAIINGKVETLWNVELTGDAAGYQKVADALNKVVLEAPVADIFLHYEKTAGTSKNYQQTVGGTVTWDHFFITLPPKYVQDDKLIPTQLAKVRDARNVMMRGLTEIKQEDIETVLELIAQKSLYRGEEHLFAIQEFLKLKAEFSKVPNENVGAWTWTKALTAPGSVAGFRNTVIGTLLVDLSEGMDLEKAVKAFEAKVAPANYKRPTALVTKAMIDKARKTVEELGLTPALERRYAEIGDITVNNILFVDRGARPLMKDVFDTLSEGVPVSTKGFDKVEEISIDTFLAKVLPTAKGLEIMMENRHAGNLVSLVAPVDATAPSLFKWDNKFSWSYNGDVADSIKERVKAAGGRVEGDLCCRLAWEYTDDLDFHMLEPERYEIFFSNRQRISPNGGVLDVDANGIDGVRKDPAENIVYQNAKNMKAGVYTLFVHNWARRSDGVGFEVEIEFNGQKNHIVYDKVVKTKNTVVVAKIEKTKTGELKLVESLPSSQSTKQLWGISTNTFRKVNVVMMSPNHWDGQGVGNKHFFFMLDGCVNEGKARGFYNEFLKSELDPVRKTLELVGSKMKTDNSANQLSGLGFSSTQRNSVLCKVSGAFSRVVKITF